MKKTVTIILTAVLAAFMAVTASCADGKWYGFAEIENAVITKGDAAEKPMTVTENKDASGGKLVNLVKSEGDINKRNRSTQADFECLECGHIANADYNAARNIATPDIANIIKNRLAQQKKEGKPIE